MKTAQKLWVLAAVAALALPATVAAQEAGAADDESIEEIVTTGTRSRARSVADSPVAIDSFSQDQLDMQPIGDMSETLKNLVPSFTATPLTGDASAFVRPVSLRGLPPDETLLLVNGKRRHRGALLALFGAAMNFGSHAADMGMLPSIAFKRVEVLRDGASSQYGSDAIAGVINFILRDDAEGGRVEAQYGQYYEGENSYKVAGWKGFQLGSNGFLTIAGEWTDNEQLIRSTQRPGAQALVDQGITVGLDNPYSNDKPNRVQTWGRPENDGVRTAWNMGVEMDGNKEFYSFGNYASTSGNYRFFWRSPGNNALLPVPIDPTDADGDGIPGSDDDPNSADEFEGNFAWGDSLPGGFTPYFVGRQTDLSASSGVRGEFDNEMAYDFSVSYGRNLHEYTLFNSISPTWGPENQFDFRTGDIEEIDRSVNADFSYPVNDQVNFAFGAEWREEAWRAEAGDVQSWVAGPWAGVGALINPEDTDCEGGPPCFYSAPAVGSSGRSGFDGDAAGTYRRSNWAVYGDVEYDVNEDFLLQFALRWEDFSDFGTTTNGKIAARYNVSDRFTLRGAVSTGFRAPTPGQSNQRVVSTTFDTATREQTVAGTIPPDDPNLIPLGGKALDPEEAENISIGFTADVTDNLNVTFDWYSINVDDRIIKTSRISVANVPGFEDAPFSIAEFYTNGADTETRGFDIVATYDLDHSDGSNTAFSFAFNHNDTEVSNLDIVEATGNPVISDQRLFNIEKNLPENRASVAAVHHRDQWRFTVRANWYDEAFDEGNFPDGEKIDAAATFDLEGRYTVNDSLTLVLGANNAFDKYPNEVSTRQSQGLPYSRRTPFGYDGGMWYLKGVYDF